VTALEAAITRPRIAPEFPTSMNNALPGVVRFVRRRCSLRVAMRPRSNLLAVQHEAGPSWGDGAA
jgi:hypothetical protein